MANKSSIEWTDATWTPIRARVKQDAGAIAAAKGYTSLVQIATDMAGRVGPHCERVSPGCEHCYSETNNGRCLPHNGTGLPFDRRARDLVDVILDEKILLQPLHWRPKNIFVCSQTDLFGDWVPDEVIDRVVLTMMMAKSLGHTFQVLTKRAQRMHDYFCSNEVRDRVCSFWMKVASEVNGVKFEIEHVDDDLPGFHIPHVWLGVSVEDQQRADERIPLLLQTPAAVRWISAEPLLGPIRLDALRIAWQCSGCHNYFSGPLKKTCPKCGREDYWCGSHIFNPPHGQVGSGIDWVIVGGESGPGSRPMHPDWARSLRDQCQAADVPFLFKQWGEFAQCADPVEVRNKQSGDFETIPAHNAFKRVGKKRAGRLLDGVLHDGYPEEHA